MSDNSNYPGMTCEEYYAAVRKIGIGNLSRSSERTLHGSTRENTIAVVPAPEPLTAEERASTVELLRMRYEEY